MKTEDLIIKYLRKKGVCRFSDIENFLKITNNDIPKSSLSVLLNRLEKEGKIISWYEKGAKFLSLPIDKEKVKNDIYKIIDDFSFTKKEFTIDDIKKRINVPDVVFEEISSQVLLDLTNKGKIQNSIVNGNIVYKFAPLHLSIKFLIILSVLYIIIFLLKDNLQKIFIILFSLVINLVTIFLWKKFR